jgi:hypothetical protein
LLGFFIVIGLSSLSAKKDKSLTFDESVMEKSPGTPIEKKTGSVMTPGGRRSARIAKTRRKEE